MINPVQAKSFIARHHLKAFIMPKKYRGTWRRGKEKIKITRNKYDNFKLYKLTKKTNNIPCKNNVALTYKHGKEIVLAIPQSDGWSVRRQGKYLVWYSMGTRVKYRR